MLIAPSIPTRSALSIYSIQLKCKPNKVDFSYKNFLQYTVMKLCIIKFSFTKVPQLLLEIIFLLRRFKEILINLIIIKDLQGFLRIFSFFKQFLRILRRLGSTVSSFVGNLSLLSFYTSKKEKANDYRGEFPHLGTSPFNAL